MNLKWIPENLKGLLACIVLIASFTYFFVITFLEKQADQQVIIAIVTANSMVLQYYFGSSQGNSKKDEIIANMNATPTATTNSGDINLDKTDGKA